MTIERRGEDVENSLIIKDYLDESSFELLPINEKSKSLAKRFIEIVKSVSVLDWKTGKIDISFKNGVTVYAYFEYTGVSRRKNGRKIARVKVRLSDHVGRWSGMNIDLRNPKDNKLIKDCLRSRILEVVK